MVIKLFTNILVLALLLVIILFGYDRFMRPVTRHELNFFCKEMSQVKEARYVSFGNSQAKRLKLGFDDPNVVADLSINGNDLQVIYHQIRDLSPALKGKIVFVDLSCFSLRTLLPPATAHLLNQCCSC